MEFAAALMVAEPEGQWWFWHHLEKSVSGADKGTLLARNLPNVFSAHGKTLEELRAYCAR